MPRLIDADAMLEKIDEMMSNVSFTSPYQDEINIMLQGMERVRDCLEEAPTIDPESLRPPWRGEKGASPDDPPGPSFLEADKAVPVEKLGKLGKLMIPYKGCPRGQMGRMCDATLEEEALYMGVITDEDGGRWVPVNEAVLRELIEKAKDRPHGRWEEADDGDGYVCSACGEDFCNLYIEVERFNFCPNCGAKMDLEE